MLKGLPGEGERKCNAFQLGHSDLRSFKMTVNSYFVCQVQSLLTLCRAEWKCPKMRALQIGFESQNPIVVIWDLNSIAGTQVAPTLLSNLLILEVNRKCTGQKSCSDRALPVG